MHRALQAYLPRKEPRRYLYDLLPSYPLRGGKMLRPSLCIATCRAFGGSFEETVGSAVALELMHNAFLIHDDIEDESEQRRGQPTLHRQQGIPLAINAGDGLMLAALQPLLDNRHSIDPQLSWLVFAEFARAVQETIEGQAVELGWRRDNAIIESRAYLGMILKKTCWYTAIAPVRVGALIATRSELHPDEFVPFGYFLGAAFQIQDDVLSLTGDPEQTGKERAGDLLEGKRTLMLVHLFDQATAHERASLLEFLGTPRQQRTSADVSDVVRLMEHHGSIEYARSYARELAGAALSEFGRSFGDLPESEDKDLIEGLVLHMLSRDS